MINPKYVLHTTPESNIDQIKKNGFRYKEGYPTVSGSLVFALEHSRIQGYKEKPDTKDQLRKILVMESPKDKYIKPGYKGGINIKEQEGEIHGRPMIWAGCRMQSAIYEKQNLTKLFPKKFSDFTRKQIYSFVKENNLNQEKILKTNLIAEISPTEELNQIAQKLRKQIWNLSPINFEGYILEITNELKNPKHLIYNKEIPLTEISKDLLYTTIEQEVINFVRSLYLTTMENKGYSIYKNEEKMSLLKRKEYKEAFQKLFLFQKTVNDPSFDLTGQSSLKSLNRYLRIYINNLYEKKLDINIDDITRKIKKLFSK